MQKWNKTNMKKEIEYLKNILLTYPNNINAKKDLETLKELLKSIKCEKNTYYTIKEDQEELKELNNIDAINNLYILSKEESEHNIEFKKIEHSDDYIIDFSKNLINFINPVWFNSIIKNINKSNINFSNSNYVCYLPFLDKFYISLSKDNTINDLFYSIHEFSHIYTYKINKNIDNKIEKEFLSILSELILAYEMKKREFYIDEIKKYELDNYIQLLNFVNIYILRKYISNLNIEEKDKYKTIENISNLNKKDIKKLYDESITYYYSYIISYLIAIELFYIYINDEKKCFKICDEILKTNNLENTLNDNNIILFNNTDKYIKSLKKRRF